MPGPTDRRQHAPRAAVATTLLQLCKRFFTTRQPDRNRRTPSVPRRRRPPRGLIDRPAAQWLAAPVELANAAIADVGGQRRVKDLSGLEAEGLNSVEDALARTEQDGRDVEGELVDHAGVQRLSHG